ncbi:ABC transporter permease [Hymenobacter sp. BT770]|uniref:ABC transporter permease n=1 Tax=Hymenobacter sp. BT770 TaxID=2886942 RepID=UPI001D120A20|nr:ABC transporter permease [Hymenobacter sp. BT770]MCC3153816.1 ABC transporter permease [Hymenobacter sp. BT770]MDO3415960.1 ABC transporter permease [Hymenobacter sp. BT770]
MQWTEVIATSYTQRQEKQVLVQIAEEKRLTSPPTTSLDDSTQEWTEVIEPRTHLLDLRLGDVWRYRDLVMMFVRRDFVSTYKQTILGPIWFFVQPLLTTLTFIIVFGRVAKLSTDGLPQVVFYLAGVTVWNYFSQTLMATSTVFIANAAIFGKVYFPRLTMPVSIVVSNIVRFLIQFGLFLAVWLYYLMRGGSTIQPNWLMLLTPVLLVVMGLLSLGLGMIFSSLTTKYRDLAMLLTFGVQLLMYATPVIYPLSSIPTQYKWLILANPMSAIVETFRYAFLGSGSFQWAHLTYSVVFTAVILFVGTIIFNKVEKSFTDTV